LLLPEELSEGDLVSAGAAADHGQVLTKAILLWRPAKAEQDKSSQWQPELPGELSRPEAF
jgi:hypothetical protein